MCEPIEQQQTAGEMRTDIVVVETNAIGAAVPHFAKIVGRNAEVGLVERASCGGRATVPRAFASSRHLFRLDSTPSCKPGNVQGVS